MIRVMVVLLFTIYYLRFTSKGFYVSLGEQKLLGDRVFPAD